MLTLRRYAAIFRHDDAATSFADAAADAERHAADDDAAAFAATLDADDVTLMLRHIIIDTPHYFAAIAMRLHTLF